MRPSQIPTLKECEQALDDALRQLRALDGSSNIMARASIEYRIFALRKRRETLMA